ncbi:hypothetical protein [Permianibacter aggregans]|uniref:Uncharacterized protein n=1 Tax=Permianibacter aggregans TaxID=1510150 RepID=A0A4R6UQH3_9GAMM|nr:hypothetical protein [Permianibacter aggregans]QGX40248.1 hypothetical protein E2H98_11430 [Permianibacter aggregans]TDQ47505.1 hypothetical protein EV696_11097 [Permianibacter aggregans]
MLLIGKFLLVIFALFLSSVSLAATPSSLQSALDDLRNRSYLLNEDQIRPKLKRIAEQFTADTPQAIRDDWTTQHCRVFKPTAEQTGFDYANAQLIEFQ